MRPASAPARRGDVPSLLQGLDVLSKRSVTSLMPGSLGETGLLA